MSTAILTGFEKEKSTEKLSDGRPMRPAWIEIDVGQLRRNFQIINTDKPFGLQILSVVKDDAYGHGALKVAKTALDCGASFLAVGSLDEAMALRDRDVMSPILLLGERQAAELPWCIEHRLTCCVSDGGTVERLGRLAARAELTAPLHIKVNTGMNRYGVRWTEAAALAKQICESEALELEGVLSHFSMSDETDKTFARLQMARFNEALNAMAAQGMRVKYRHLCNSGGFLDLPEAHFDMVRLGMLQFGVYPSKVCRRMAGIAPVMTVKARIAGIQQLQAGDMVGYGMRYTAASERRIAVIPVGYGDGFPRMRNQGCVLAGGRRAPLVGGVAMDALTVDITEIPEAGMWDEVVLMGRQGDEEISVHEVAQWKNSVSYDVLAGWRARLPRVYVGE